MNNINKTIAALFMAATFLPMSAQTTAKKECCKEKTECGKTLCCKTGCEKNEATHGQDSKRRR